VVVNAVLVPPVYIRPAGEAIYELADDMARVLEGAADLAEGWSGEDAYERLQEARELDREVGEAREAVRQAEDSLRLNPRRRPASPGPRPTRHLLANVDRLLSELDPEGRTWPGTSPHA
jgi:hypothetical protein